MYVLVLEVLVEHRAMSRQCILYIQCPMTAYPRWKYQHQDLMYRQVRHVVEAIVITDRRYWYVRNQGA